MKQRIKSIAKAVALTLSALVLVIIGLVMCLYSAWCQESVREALVTMINRQPDTRFELREFSLDFPLDLSVRGVTLVQGGDTMIHADTLDASVKVLPLLAGRVDLNGALGADVRYQMGTRDSATCIVIRAGRLTVAPSTVALSPMHIDLSDAKMARGSVDIFLNPSVPPTPTDTTPPSPMVIDARKLTLDDFTYRMSMMPTIDSLGTHFDHAVLTDGHIDVSNQKIDLKSFDGSGMDVTYLMPDAEAAAATVIAPPPAADTIASKPWEIKLAHLAMDKSSALYTTRGYTPTPGLDFGYIQVSDMTLAVDSFYNCGTDMTIPVKVSGRERCGVFLDLGATLGFDATKMTFGGISLTTPEGTDIAGSGMLGVGDMTTDPNLPLGLNIGGQIATSDLALIFPMMSPYTLGLSPSTMADLDVNVAGTPGRLNIAALRLSIPRSVTLNADGSLDNLFSPAAMGGTINFKGKIGDLSPWRQLLAGLGGVQIPPMDLDGHVTFGGDSYKGKFTVHTAHGSLAADGHFNGRGRDYSLDLVTDNFPVNAFMPTYDVGTITSHIVARGQGFDVFSPRTKADVDVTVSDVVYHGKPLHDITLKATLADSHADIDLHSPNRKLDFDLTAAGNLAGAEYDWTADIQARDIDLQAFGLAQTPTIVQGDVALQANINAKRPTILATTVNIGSFTMTDSLGPMTISNVKARLDATDSLMNASISNNDLYAYFSSPMSLPGFLARFDSISATLAAAKEHRRIDIERLQRAIPRFDLDIDAGPNNFINDMLAKSDMSFQSLTVRAYNDTTVNLEAAVNTLSMGETKIDDVTFDVHQTGNRLNYQGHMRNKPGTLDEWASVDVNGFFRPGRLGIAFTQRNIAGQTGYAAGAHIDLNPDSTATLKFDTLDPTIAYAKWTVNADNFLKYNFATKHIDANLRMTGAGSSLAIYTENAESHDAGKHTADEDLIVKLSDIHLEDWIKFNPFAPPIKGLASADMVINYDHGLLNARGDVTVNDLLYGREKVGDMKADVDLTTGRDGYTHADVSLWVNGNKSLTLTGILNDSTMTSPFDLNMKMIHFPLSTVNPFLPGIAHMTGTLNGSLDIAGDSKAPHIDGSLQFDSTAVHVDMIGAEFRFSPTQIPVKDNNVRITNFTITGQNENPLVINGTVNIRSLADMLINLKLNANRTQIVNTTRAAKGSDLYGKAYISLDATVKGSLDMLNIDAKATINSGSNFTYVMPDAVETLTSQGKSDMVKFVNFNDTLSVAAADSVVISGTAMNLKALLTIENNTTIGVDLSANGQDRVQLNTTGTLDYTSTPMGQERLTGRLNINKGFVRYTPPLMSQKLFDFNEGSYVAFRGDITNPELNISATDRVRANVTQEGQNSRLIYFDVGLAVTGTLQTMNVQFDLSTDDDITIANELASMSQTQRASEAMNLLLYNIYTGPGTKANANLSVNPLYSFLTSKLNNLAANAIKGVDISFGIDQYDRTNQGVTQQTTSYSYQVSKSLFNDRFKISVGGNYSTDADAEQNVAQNLISDISLEYLLNKSGTMVIRIFRHTGYESILEGEITQTGVGFVYRRKLRRLSDMFRFRRHRRVTTPAVYPEPDTTVTGKPLQ